MAGNRPLPEPVGERLERIQHLTARALEAYAAADETECKKRLDYLVSIGIEAMEILDEYHAHGDAGVKTWLSGKTLAR